MMDWNDGVDAGWIVAMCLVMLAAALLVSGAVYYAVREATRDRHHGS